MAQSKEPPVIQSLYRYDYQVVRKNRLLEFSSDPRRQDGMGKVPQKAGQNSGYSQVDLQHPKSKYWRGLVGTFIAHRTKMDSSLPWHMKDWPKGYSFWVTMRKTGEHDYYLYGYKRYFRSPIEFAFHAWYLYDDDEFKRGCRCLVDTNRRQSEVNEVELGKEPPITPSKPRETNQQHSDNYAAPHLPISNPDLSSTRRKIHHHNFKNSLYDAVPQDIPDLRERTEQLGQRFRSGEVVWVSIRPIAPSNSTRPDLTIEMWPAYITPSRRRSSLGNRYGVVLMYGNDEEEQMVDEAQILAYKAYSWPEDLTKVIFKHRPKIKLSRDLNELPSFPVIPPPGRSLPPSRTFESALLAFTVATVMSDDIGRYWSLSECWKRSPSGSQEVETETSWYQGLWLGHERIWVGDLVRITHTREDLENEGLADGLKVASPQAKRRGLLLYVTSISDAIHDGELDAVVAGSLYEVAGEHHQDRPSHNQNQSTPVERLPTAPHGFHFRKITPDGKEARLPIGYLAGRYDDYSNRSPIIRNIQKQGGFMSSSKPHSREFLRELTERLELCSSLKAMKIHVYRENKPTREAMIEDAKVIAGDFCYKRWFG
ncbi:hypothetical protein FRC02_005185 [Tulasnella sp. 418]|nr:hypothetical protein FRC02_005185 [Tulasnella sp. 418]